MIIFYIIIIFFLFFGMIYYGKLLDDELKNVPVKCIYHIGMLLLFFSMYGVVITKLFSLL